MAMSYLVFVVPGMLADAGMPKRIKHCSRNLGHHFRNPAYGALGQVSSWSKPRLGISAFSPTTFAVRPVMIGKLVQAQFSYLA